MNPHAVVINRVPLVAHLKFFYLPLSALCLIVQSASSPAQITLASGGGVDRVLVPGRPPDGYREPPAEDELYSIFASGNLLGDVPAYDWSYGCAPTAAAMLAGYYDRTDYPNMYTGPAGGGVAPLDNTLWGSGECPISASRQGLDGRATKGHVDDFWVSYLNCSTDPWNASPPRHIPDDCTADFMGTSQGNYGNCDGSTVFHFNSSGNPLHDYTGAEPSVRDGCHGLKLFAESRGYAVDAAFSQYIAGYNGNTNGFTFEKFKDEIDAGRPVLIHVTGHTMLGYGYHNSGNTVFLNDTWDNLPHQMTWGHIYAGLQHFGVTVLRLETGIVAKPVLTPSTGIATNVMTTSATCATPGATIRYTTDGTDPTSLSIPFTSPFTVSQSMTLKLRAFRNGYTPSEVTTGTYTLNVPTPYSTPSAGNYYSGRFISLACPLSGTSIRYTTDLSEPTLLSTPFVYPIYFANPVTLKFKAFRSGWTPSQTVSATYTFSTPVTIEQAKLKANGAAVNTTGIVTAATTNYFWMQSESDHYGIRIDRVAHGCTKGQRATVNGTIYTNGLGERYILASSVTTAGTASVNPLQVTDIDIGGQDFYYNNLTGAGQRGIQGSLSQNNIGSLVRLSGTITYSSASYFYINPQSSLRDGTGFVGIRVNCSGLTPPLTGSNIEVTAISSMFKVSSVYQRQLFVTKQTDIRTVQFATISGTVYNGLSQLGSAAVESAHPYPILQDLIYTIDAPTNATRIRVRFQQIELQPNKDFVKVLDKAGSVKQIFNSYPMATNLWTTWIDGYRLRLNLYTDVSSNYYGFRVNQYECTVPGSALANITMALTPGPKSVVTGTDGRFSFTNLQPGLYTIRPTSTFTFSASEVSVAVVAGQVKSGIDFVKHD